MPLDAPAAIVRLLRDLIASLGVMRDQPISGAQTDYPLGTVRELLATDAVSEPTRQVLCDRLNTSVVADGEFFDSAALKTLRAICARLIPQSVAGDVIDIAGAIDRRLAGGRGNGWRYDVLPEDGKTYRIGLRGIDDVARAAFSTGFCEISNTERDQVLSSVQHNKVAGGCWTALPPGRFFEELLAEASGIYFSHPLAQERIGYVGMADKPGWSQVGLNMLAAREPEPLGVPHG
jgi:gluconate 2-dehydrogenase gamma chain